MPAPSPRADITGNDPAHDTETLAGLLDVHLERRARRLLTHLSARGRRLSTAESCTGGILASLFTDVEGVSHVFDRGLVTYASSAKHEVLGLDPDLIERHGAVSRPVAIAMAEALVGDDPDAVGVSTTGCAGAGEEPGLVHLALARGGQPTVHHEARFGTIGRGGVRIGAVVTAIRLMEENL